MNDSVRKNPTIFVSFLALIGLFLSFLNIDIFAIVGLLNLIVPILLISLFGLGNRWFYKISKQNIFVLFPLFLLALYYIVWSIASENPFVSIQRGGLIIVYIMFFIFYFNIGLVEQKRSVNLTRSLYVFLMVLFVIFLVSIDFVFYYWNPNVIGLYISMLFFLLFSLSNYNVLKVIFVFFGFYFIFISESRTALIAYMSSILFFVSYKFIYRRQIVYYAFFLVLICFSGLMVFFTINDQLYILSDYSQKISSKNIESGRNLIWPIVYDFISKKPILGYGGGVNLSNIYDTHLSAHNLYLQVSLQVGLLGLSLLLLFYYMLWRVMFVVYKRYRNENIRYVNSIFIWLLMIQNFEITLFQNNIALSLPMFAIMSYFLGKSIDR